MTLEQPAIAKPTREPRQGRSRASFERMLAAAEDLLRERGNDDFTLTEVSRQGKVSIGSIYCRFDSKDELIQAVHSRTMEQMIDRHIEMIANTEPANARLQTLVPALVQEIGELMRNAAPIMRPLMARAAIDPIVAVTGKRAYMDFSDRITAALLAHRGEIKHPDPERAVDSCVRIIYAALARYLGFGSSITAVGQGDWTELKVDLGDMCTAFLTSVPARL